MMVQELLSHQFEIVDDEGDTLYENVSVYQNFQPKAPIYENAVTLREQKS